MSGVVSAETWRSVEIELTAEGERDDPLVDLEVDAVFTHEDGSVVTRPVFWDGGITWRVRFAPPCSGRWQMWTRVTRGEDVGLAAAAATIDAVDYAGELDVYRRGFLRVSDDGRHFVHADGTPFLYLGDTHWVLPHERLDLSNAPGTSSQFAEMVDTRARQGFTVYQSEPIWQPHREWSDEHERADEMPVADLNTGFDEGDLPGFAQLDRKFQYIAEAGLVHANGQITWAKDPAEHPDVYTADFMARMARYWVARYGAYPVIWTLAQEIDKDMYGAYTPDTIGVWHAAGRAIAESDDYHQVIMPHMENTSTTRVADSSWKDLPWHDAFGAQLQDWDIAAAREFWELAPTKPTIAYETRYEDFWTDARGALASGYIAFQLGMRGYGYGVAGVWNDVYSTADEPPDFGTDYELPARYLWWYDGLRRPTGDQLTRLRDFYAAREWWRFEPRFDDPSWSVLAPGAYLSSDGDERFILFVSGVAADSGVSPGLLQRLTAASGYAALWFDPRTGEQVAVEHVSVDGAGRWIVPAPPSREDWVLTVERLP